MKLSVCIPVFNCDVKTLVADLSAEISTKNLDAEIIVIDDSSTLVFSTQNFSNSVKFYQLKENIGRSKIRNLFLKYTDSEYFLFLDCDAKIISKNFLDNYFELINNENPAVAFGGFTETEKPGNLRSKYSREREIQPLETRRKNPYGTFRGINFLIKRSILQQFPFDETIRNYGYEDYLFAYRLKENEIPITHLENPVLHCDFSTNEEFLAKTETAVQTLSPFLKNSGTKSVSEMKLVKAYTFLQKNGLSLPFSMIFKIFRRSVRKQLLKGNPNLRLLDFYKLGLLLQQK